MGRPWSSVALLLVLCALACHRAAAHGSLYSPKARNWVRDLPSGMWYTYPNGPNAPGQNGAENFGNGLGLSSTLPRTGPGVCGDPFQNWNLPDYYANLGNLPAQATYISGQTITIEWVIAANHGGRLGLKLCPTGAKTPAQGLTQACFDQYELQRADNLGRWYYILEGSAPLGGLGPFLGRRSGTFRLPAGVTCQNGCVLQFEYQTTNSCMPSDIQDCPREICGAYKDRLNPVIAGQSPTVGDCCIGPNCPLPGTTVGEVFYNCADIVINPGTPISPLPPSPSPRPPSSPSPSPRPPSPSPSPPVGCVDTNAACPVWGVALCTNPGVAATCPCMCGAPRPSPTPSPSPSPRPPSPSPSPPSGCVDNYAACPGWGSASCGVPGVATFCPCMCAAPRIASTAGSRLRGIGAMAAVAPVEPAPAATGAVEAAALPEATVVEAAAAAAAPVDPAAAGATEVAAGVPVIPVAEIPAGQP